MKQKSLFVICNAFLIGNIYGYNNGVNPLPAMGWNSWCSDWFCGSDVCSYTEVITVAQAMIDNGMHELGWNYLNLDDCWEACWRSDFNESDPVETWDKGNIIPAPERFPYGIRNLTDTVHAMGFKFGLYTSAGIHTCNPGARPCEVPGSYNHYQDDANTFAQWGLDYVKLDWCGTDHISQNYSELQPQFSEALNNTGRTIWFEICRGYPYPPPASLYQISNSWRINGDHRDEWASTLKAILHVGDNTYNVTSQSGPYNWAYMDFLMTGGQGCPGVNPNVPKKHCPGQTNIEYKTEFSIWSITASPLIVAVDVREMTPIMNEILLNKDVINVNQQYDTPAGKQILSYNCDPNVTNACQVWTRIYGDMSGYTNSIAVLLLNIGDSNHTINIDFEYLNVNWSNETNVEIYDLWEHKIIGTFTGNYSSMVVSHGVVFTRMTESQ
mmetsp:Transcript_10672/g.13266  ORF Transcript_10672/g.13266 Transcript_10672/m.13266 type:complete len:440 (+) Transcript_10672:297-1616(+)